MSWKDQANPHIGELKPYEPGRPIEEVEKELGIRGAVKLASNENPLGPSPLAVAAVQEAVASVHRYPDGGCSELRARLASHLGLSGNHFIFGSGAEEILELAAKTFLAASQHHILYRCINGATANDRGSIQISIGNRHMFRIETKNEQSRHLCKMVGKIITRLNYFVGIHRCVIV